MKKSLGAQRIKIIYYNILVVPCVSQIISAVITDRKEKKILKRNNINKL